jgi:HlyD family secretion protein
VAQLTSDVEQATRALERVILKTGADIVQAEADLKAREAELNQQRSREGKIRDQITKTRIEAPRDGLVVYATSVQAQNRFRGGSAPLEAGQTVRERQELIYLPTADQMTAEVQIHESNLNKLRIGLPAVVTVDALEGKTFMGKVTKIALLPDAGSMWMNPDLKVYSTQIVLDGLQPGLRTGMSCMAEIVVERHEDALCVPIQSVVKVDGEPTVYVKAKEGFEPARVEVGMDNGRIILVQSGVEEGQMVMLTPPLQAAAAPEKKELSNAVVAERLKAAERAPAGGGHEATRTPAQTEHQAEGGNGPAGPTPGQREEMRKHFESMTPEQREELRRQTAGRRGRRNQETE